MQQKAISYLRFSSAEQGKGTSVKRQLEASEAYAKANNLILDTRIRDEGKSAFKGAHLKGGLGAFLSAIQAGQIEPGTVLLVENLDRLSRADVPTALGQLLSITSAGIEIVTLMDGQRYSNERLQKDWTPLIMALTVMARAHEESSTKKDRSEKAWMVRRQSAVEDKAPMTGRRPFWLDWDGKQFTINPERALIVKRIFNDTIKYGHGMLAISCSLNREGVPFWGNRKSNGWEPGAITRVIANRAVIGEVQPSKMVNGKKVPLGEPIAGYYPSVIDLDTWNKAQAVRQLNTQGGGTRRGEMRNLMQGRVFCAVCGSHCQIRTNGKKYHFYICDAAYRHHPKCNNRRYTQSDNLTEAVVGGLDYLSHHRNSSKNENPRAVELRNEMAELGIKLERQRERMSKMLDLLEDDPVPEAMARVKRMGEEIRVFEARKVEAEKELSLVGGRETIGEQIAEMDALKGPAFTRDHPDRTKSRNELSVLLRAIVDEVRIDAERAAHVTCKGGLLTFRVEAGHISDVVFQVNEQRWALMPTGRMELLQA